ncbi:MAG: cupin domain-containing protein [Anaerofustis sp.]
MNIKFDQTEETILPNFRGGEKEFSVRTFQDSANKILYGKLIPGASIGLHAHETNSEIIYILSGAGKMLTDGEWETLSVGICNYCPKGHAHSMVNDGDEDLVFFAVVAEQ